MSSEKQAVIDIIQKVMDDLAAQTGDIRAWNKPGNVIFNVGASSQAIGIITNGLKDVFHVLDTQNEDQVISTIAEVLDEYIKLPIWMEPFDKVVFEKVLKFVVSFLKNKFNVPSLEQLVDLFIPDDGGVA